VEALVLGRQEKSVLGQVVARAEPRGGRGLGVVPGQGQSSYTVVGTGECCARPIAGSSHRGYRFRSHCRASVRESREKAQPAGPRPLVARG
jgi:hypothetical protein